MANSTFASWKLRGGQIVQFSFGGMQIVEGPPRESLFDSLRVDSGEKRISVSFKAIIPSLSWFGADQQFMSMHGQRTYALRGYVQSITREDDSGHDWVIEVNIALLDDCTLDSFQCLRMFYNSQTRTGQILSPASD